MLEKLFLKKVLQIITTENQFSWRKTQLLNDKP